MELTIAVITKNRPRELKKCLASILIQTDPEFSILVIDNDPARTAQPVFNHFKLQNKIAMEYIGEPVPGYSNARNCALKHCKTQFIGFIDDDCVLDRDWVQHGLAAIRKYHSAYVIGASKNSPAGSIFAKVERFATTRWWVNTYDQTTFEIKPENLDTKKVILDKSILEQRQIAFDPAFNRYGGEDADLGFQIKQQNLKGYFVPEMKLAHVERVNFRRFKRKAFSYGYNCYNLYRKWISQNECQGWDQYQDYQWEHTRKLLPQLKRGNIIKDYLFLLFIQLFYALYLKGFFTCKNERNL